MNNLEKEIDIQIKHLLKKKEILSNHTKMYKKDNHSKKSLQELKNRINKLFIYKKTIQTKNSLKNNK